MYGVQYNVWRREVREGSKRSVFSRLDNCVTYSPNTNWCNEVESYLLSNFKLDNDPTENDPDKKPCREKRLVNAFKQSVSKPYAMFVQSVIPIFDSFNTFLQAKEPLIHILYHSTLWLYCSLLSRFILPEVLSELDDLEDPDVLKDLNNLFIGAMKLLKEVRAFFIKCEKYLQT